MDDDTYHDRVFNELLRRETWRLAGLFIIGIGPLIAYCVYLKWFAE